MKPTKHYYKDIDLDVPESVYEPAEDTELMAEVLESAELRGKHILEIGCGSGLLSILMARKGASVMAADISEEAAYAARENAERNGLFITTIVSDMFQNIEDTYDVVVFNPPYLPTEEGENDKTYSGGKTGREVISRFIAGLPYYLNPSGCALLLISSLTGENEVLKLMEENGLSAEAIARKKIDWEELIVVKAAKARSALP